MKSIKIKSKKITIKEAKNIFQRFMGLMGKKEINIAIIFRKCNSVHTFFMKSPIDIIAINEENEINFKAKNIPKNKIIKVKNPIKKTSIIELPPNTSKSLKIGEKLTFESE